MHNTDTMIIQSKKAETDAKPLTFVNISRPVVFDKETKKLIKTHVSQDLQRQKRDHEGSVSKPFNGGPAVAHNATLCKKKLHTNSEDSAQQAMSIPQQPFVFLDPFATFPVNMEPYMYTLIHRCKCHYVSNFPSSSISFVRLLVCLFVCLFFSHRHRKALSTYPHSYRSLQTFL